MGNFSYLYATRNGASKCTIVWNQCKPFKTYLLHELQEKGVTMTLEELGHHLDDTKLIGYLNADYINDLCELSFHLFCGGEPCMPRLYFDYEGWDDLYYLEFHPGTYVVLEGVYHPDDSIFPKCPDDDDDTKIWAQYERKREEVTKHLHETAMDHVEGWKISQLKEVDDDGPGSALAFMCIIQGISPHDTKGVQNYLKNLQPEIAQKLVKMRSSDLLKIH